MSTAKEPCRPRLTSGGRDEPRGGRWPGARGRRTVLLCHYFLGRSGRQDSKASLPAPRFPTGKMVTAEGRQFRWLGPGKRSAEAPVRTWVITVSASGTMGPSRCRWRCAWPHSVLAMTGEARHLHEPRWQKGKSGREEAGRFPQGHTADRRRVEIPAQAAWAAAPSGGLGCPHPAPAAQRSRAAGTLEPPASRRGPSCAHATGPGPRR